MLGGMKKTITYSLHLNTEIMGKFISVDMTPWTFGLTVEHPGPCFRTYLEGKYILYASKRENQHVT